MGVVRVIPGIRIRSLTEFSEYCQALNKLAKAVPQNKHEIWNASGLASAALMADVGEKIENGVTCLLPKVHVEIDNVVLATRRRVDNRAGCSIEAYFCSRHEYLKSIEDCCLNSEVHTGGDRNGAGGVTRSESSDLRPTHQIVLLYRSE